MEISTVTVFNLSLRKQLQSLTVNFLIPLRNKRASLKSPLLPNVPNAGGNGGWKGNGHDICVLEGALVHCFLKPLAIHEPVLSGR